MLDVIAPLVVHNTTKIVLVSLDGLEGIPIGPQDLVRIALARDAVRFLRRPSHTLPVVLPTKLGWSGSPRRSRG